jgi:hypothetical protein
VAGSLGPCVMLAEGWIVMEDSWEVRCVGGGQTGSLAKLDRCCRRRQTRKVAVSLTSWRIARPFAQWLSRLLTSCFYQGLNDTVYGSLAFSCSGRIKLWQEVAGG